MKRLLVFALTFLFILSSVVMAQGPDISEDPVGWTFYLFGLPTEWAEDPRDILFYFIVPFIGIWMIVLGFLRVIRIFGESKIYYPLSFIIAFATLPTRIFTLVVVWLFGSMGFWSVALFAAMFFVGTYLYTKGWLSRTGRGAIKIAKKIDKLKKKKAKLEKRLAREKGLHESVRDQQQINVWEAEIKAINEEINKLEAQRKTEEARYKTWLAERYD